MVDSCRHYHRGGVWTQLGNELRGASRRRTPLSGGATVRSGCPNTTTGAVVRGAGSLSSGPTGWPRQQSPHLAHLP